MTSLSQGNNFTAAPGLPFSFTLSEQKVSHIKLAYNYEQHNGRGSVANLVRTVSKLLQCRISERTGMTK
jgi:hypothetical protein